ncbi:ABC transporter permease [Leucobacter chromiireducens]|uniref:ABC transporter permease n=1 Tax=Leucobacter chromiireducens subsp. chromiireducens TaxID=660067 RepID=A0ABS1SQL9_9MICO|nr:ABC transporter permease [Leucobacter chromiireducens]MBL3690449.1 ABC transporter permease [Leucobacter chromiireducens subsp. chromiireducens]
MTQTEERAAGPRARGGVLSDGVRAIGFELRGYFRVPDTVFFTFLFPIMLLGIFGAAFQSMGEVGQLPDGTGGVSMAAYYLPGLVAAGPLLAGVQNLAIDIARERSDGWLRRLGGTPLSPVSYFIGKIGVTLITSVLQLALLLAFAVMAFGVELPSEPEAWLRLTWLFLLGIATMTLLGVALSALPRSSRSASAVVIPVVLVLQFISGIYLQFTMLPEWLQHVASVFPLKWLAQGMRSVFLPDHLAAAELSGSWEIGTVALVLAGWLIAGLVVSLLTFRWQRRS